MEKEFVTYEIALKLKELGFDEPCIAGFNSYNILKHNIATVYEDNHDYISIFLYFVHYTNKFYTFKSLNTTTKLLIFYFNLSFC